MFYDFTTTTQGKWILAGEHAVLRGHEALVFPVTDYKLTLSYYHSPSQLNANYEGTSSADMHLLFWSVLEEGQQLLGHSLNQLTGHFNINSNIPLGVGLGASAALCVAMARWFAAQNFIAQDQIADFARKLENLFHGKSSGLDIAGVAAKKGIRFKLGAVEPLLINWQPQWYLSSCGQVGITSHCIKRVNELWQIDPDKGAAVDQLMSKAVTKARQALGGKQANSQALLIEALKEGTECFNQWGLISANLNQHMQALYEQGALAVKPTGSGNGGYVISLWDQITPPALEVELITL